MSEKVVTLARQRGALVAILCRANQEESGLRCDLVERRIDEMKPVVCPSAVSIGEAWRSLARFRVDDPAVIAAAVRVLLETVPSETRASAPIPCLPAARATRRRTAAHPRGFRGRRLVQSPAVDLRAVISHRQAWPALRQALRFQSSAVFKLLETLGYERDRLAGLLDARDPYVAYHHRSGEGTLAALPRRFTTRILPLLRSCSWDAVLRSIALYRALDLERDDPLLASVVHLLDEASNHGVAWWSLVVAQAPERRAACLQIVVETRAHEAEPVEVGGALDMLAPLEGWKLEDRLTHLLASVRAGVPVGHVIEGFRIADEFDPDHRFDRRRRGCPHVVASPGTNMATELEAQLRPVLRHVAGAVAEWDSCFPIRLWERCSEMPALLRVLERPCLLEWPGMTTLRVLRALLDCEDAGAMEGRLREVDGLLRPVPAEQHASVLDAWGAFLNRWANDAERRRHMPVAGAFAARLARSADGTEVWLGCVAADLVEAARGRAARRLLGAQETSLQRLVRDMRSDNRACLLHDGLELMGRRIGSLVIDAFIGQPAALFQTARLLGGLSEARRLVLLKRFRAHPLMQRRFLKKSVEEMCRTIQEHADEGLPNPIPRKLRDHLRGGASLSPMSIERHRQALVRRLLSLKLAILRRIILADLGRGLPSIDPENASERHALQMLGSVGTNRRLLRRVLGVAPDRRQAFLLAHPANQAWLRKHPRVDVVLWASDPFQTAAGGGVAVRLAIERDPMEVLRLGTEVGSCLSVGGVCAFSSVAVMADVNKQAVFARDANGTFVARQVVAIAEDDRLVFFPVYPLAAAAVKQAFFDFDLGLARALGLEPYRPKENEDYTIALVLAQDFYDDGPWDRFVMPEDQSPERAGEVPGGPEVARIE